MISLEEWVRRQMIEEERDAEEKRRKRVAFIEATVQTCVLGAIVAILALFCWLWITAPQRAASARAAGAAKAQAAIDAAGGVRAWVDQQLSQMEAR